MLFEIPIFYSRKDAAGQPQAGSVSSMIDAEGISFILRILYFTKCQHHALKGLNHIDADHVPVATGPHSQIALSVCSSEKSGAKSSPHMEQEVGTAHTQQEQE